MGSGPSASTSRVKKFENTKCPKLKSLRYGLMARFPSGHGGIQETQNQRDNRSVGHY
jgi:hypothetical protein